jgi:hypothetical protein
MIAVDKLILYNELNKIFEVSQRCIYVLTDVIMLPIDIDIVYTSI